MEPRENLSHLLVWDKQTVQSMHDATHSSTRLLHKQSVIDSQKNTTPARSETPKAEDRREVDMVKNVSRIALNKRPSSVTDGQRARTEEQSKICQPTSRSFNKLPKNSYYASSSTSKNKKQMEKAKVKFQIPFPESGTCGSLLSLAVQEEGQVLKMLRMARERVRKKLVERSKPRAKSKDLMGDCAALLSDSLLSPRTLNSFRDSYSSALDEMFQVWMNLFYFVINLRVNLIKVLSAAGTEKFEPNVEKEKSVIIQAVECVKFFSKLKLKSLSTMCDGIDLSNSNLTESQIIDYEDKTSSSFLNDLDFMEKKAKELLRQVLIMKEM